MKQILTAILVLTTGLVFGQSFEGTLVYKTDFEFQISEKMAEMGITEEIMVEKMKKDGSWTDSITTSYKQGSYIKYSNCNPQSWSIYNPQTNKLYAFIEGENTCVVSDASVDLDYQMIGKPTIEKLDTIVEINGMKCEIVRFSWKAGVYDYYYNNSFLKIDPTLFENHIYDGWADFLKISNSLPIKIIKSIDGLITTTFDLIRHSEETIDPKLFKIPKLKANKKLNFMKSLNMEVMKIKK
ncbi:MAG: hypothetical protein FWH36_02695 [Lentimicrobiaceae bacterium]|nr:hypothetical protein [Lentimicrobiaceae bacterium]